VTDRDDSCHGPDAQQLAERESLASALCGQHAIEAELRRRLRVDGLIDQATGVLIAQLGCASSEAFAQLGEIARRSGRGLSQVAADIVGDTAAAAGDSAAVPVLEMNQPGVVAMQRSADCDELAWLLVDEALGWSSAVGAAVALLQPDGALEIVGSAGLPDSWVSQWRRIPPAADCLLTRALGSDGPAWSDQPPPAGMTQQAAGMTLPRLAGLPVAPGVVDGLRVAVPLWDGRHRLGGVEIAFPRGLVLTAGERQDVAALAAQVGPALIRTLFVGRGRQPPGSSHPGREPAWLRQVVDAVPEPMAALSPVSDADGAVADFTFSCANRAAVLLLGSGGHDIAGRRLLEAIPWAAESGAFASIRRAFATGLPYRDEAHAYVQQTGGGRRRATIGLTASRIGGDVLLALRPAAELADGPSDPAGQDGRGGLAESPSRGAALPAAGVIQRLAQVGCWEWDVTAGLVRWTPDALRILGARGSAAPMPADVPPFAPHPEDAATVDRALTALGADGRACEVEFRIVQPGGSVRHIRLAAEPLAGQDGGPALVTGVVQDVTDRRRAETALEVAQVQVAAQRGRVAAERQLADLLQQIIMPVEPVRLPATAGVRIAARYRPASAAAGIGGDWYGVFPLPGPAVLLTIGDVAGHGLSAASAMAQLHHALHGLAHIGAGPAELLGYLNVMACALPSFTLASACCALYDPASRQLRWANAGHPSPVLVAGETAEPLAGLGGTMLGVDTDGTYAEASLVVGLGDVLLLYTDGLIERRRGLEDDMAPLLAAAAGPEDDLESYVDRVLSLARSDTDDDTCLIAVRFS
jgi:PAS domain S-box-containing protein